MQNHVYGALTVATLGFSTVSGSAPPTAPLPSPVAQKSTVWGFPGGAVVKNPPASAGYTGSSPGLGRSHMPRSN